MSDESWLKDLTRDLLGMFVPPPVLRGPEARLAAARAAVREALSERNEVLERCVATRQRAQALVDATARELESTPGEALTRRLLTARSGLREAARAERAARAARDAALDAGRSALAEPAPQSRTESAPDRGPGSPGSVRGSREPVLGSQARIEEEAVSWDAVSARLVEAGGWFAPDEPGGALAARAIAQASDLAEKHARFLEVLARKLDPGELTHARYADAAEHVSVSVLRNLGDTAAGLLVLRDVDEIGVREVIATLEGARDRSGAASRELEALRARLDVAATEAERVRGLLASNEAAATALVAATAAVGALRDLGAAGTPDMQFALADLEALARRASDYG